MEPIKFNPRWREELVAVSDEGVLILEIAMGTLHGSPNTQKFVHQMILALQQAPGSIMQIRLRTILSQKVILSPCGI